MPNANLLPPRWWRKKKGRLIPTNRLEPAQTKATPSPKNSSVEEAVPSPAPAGSPEGESIPEINSAPPPAAPTEPPSKQADPLPKITIAPKTTTGVSAFSLASIDKKKEWEKQHQPTSTEENKARSPFTQDDLEKQWQIYLDKKNTNKEQNIAALFQLSTPKKITNEQVEYQVPSNMNKVELEREFVYFLPFLRSALDNFGVAIEVVVNESTEKQFIYTPEEKYHRLREINPNLDTLRKELDLEL